MGRTRIERIQDSVHGLMEFHGMDTSIVEVLRAQELQRLRRIRQLGLVHLVFPGAEHSRLVHAVGASFLATRFAKQLVETTRETLTPFFRPNPSAIRDLAIAALCHDLGHGPLSHVWEREVIGEFNREQWTQTLGLAGESGIAHLKWHELVGQSLLAWPDGQLHRLLEQLEEGSSARIRKMMAGEYYIPYLPRLISSDVDVDRCDFILRDAHQTGVAYGIFDLNWLVSTLMVGKNASNKLVVGFDKHKAPAVVEQFLIARRALYDAVYYHKTVRSAEGMIGLLLKRLKEVVRDQGWPGPESTLFAPFIKAIKGEPLQPEEILGLDDYSLFVMIQQLVSVSDKDVTVADLALRIISRDLFKMVPVEENLLDDFLAKDDAYSILHDTVSSYIPGKKEYYIYRDNASFQMFTDKETEWAYFIDSHSEKRDATPIREHPRFRTHWAEAQKKMRLFAPREAIPSIAKAINDRLGI